MNECAREIEWAGGRHVFNLNSPNVLDVLAGNRSSMKTRVRSELVPLLPLQGQYGDTPAAAFKRFGDDVYSTDDIERVMLYGLWGGGMPFAAAYELVATHVRGQPLAANAVIAFNVIAALFLGANDGNASS